MSGKAYELTTSTGTYRLDPELGAMIETMARSTARAEREVHQVRELLMPVVGGDWISTPDVVELARAAAHMIRIGEAP